MADVQHLVCVSRNSERQVLLMDRETLDKFDLSPGAVRRGWLCRGVEAGTIRKGDAVTVTTEVGARVD